MLKICPSFVGGLAQVDGNLDCPEQSVQVVMHAAQVQEEPKFGGGLGAVRTGIALF